jgi:hypothetical protein
MGDFSVDLLLTIEKIALLLSNQLSIPFSISNINASDEQPTASREFRSSESGAVRLDGLKSMITCPL